MKMLMSIVGTTMSFLLVASPVRVNLAASTHLSNIDKPKEITVRSYVQDGLLAIHDGEFNDIDNDGKYFHNPEARTWKDLSGNGYDAVCGSIGPFWGNKYSEVATNTTATGANYQSGVWFVNNCYKTIYPRMTSKGYTIEFVGLVTSQRQGLYVVLQSFSYMCISSTWYGESVSYQIDPSYTYWGGKATTGAPTTKDSGKDYAIRGTVRGISNNIFSYSVTVDFENEKTICYYNGVMVAEYDWAALTGNSYSRFFYFPQKSNYAGNRCYCARVYEKPLSGEEIQSNYNIDKVRFGL